MTFVSMIELISLVKLIKKVSENQLEAQKVFFFIL